MRVVNPGHTIAVSLARTWLIGTQHVQILLSRKQFVIGSLKISGVVRVDGPLVRLGVSYPMSMKSVGPRGKVLYVNRNFVSNFSFDDRA